MQPALGLGGALAGPALFDLRRPQGRGDQRQGEGARRSEGAQTDHYSVAQINELVDALELVADEHGRVNKTLQMLQLEGKKRVGLA